MKTIFKFKKIFLPFKKTRHLLQLDKLDIYLKNSLEPLTYTPGPEDKIILEYGIELANIRIIERRNGIIYTVDEPPLPKDIKSILIETLYEYVNDLDYETSTNINDIIISRIEKEIKYLETDIAEYNYIINYYVNKLLSGYGLLYPLVNDDYIEEISCEAPGTPVAIYHSILSEYRWINTNIYLSENMLDNFVLTLSRKIGRYLSIAFPYAEGLTEEGHRVAITLGREISYRGSSFVIRRKPSRILTITDLIKNGTLSLLETAYLMYILEYNPFIIITGSVATGKTTLLRALLTLLPDNVKIITIEDTPELQLPHTHWDPLITRKTVGGIFNTKIDIYDLAKFALRRRGDYLVIGEVRGEEARILAQASVLGYGVLTTFHADNAQAALIRLTMPPISLSEKIRSNIWSIIHLQRTYYRGRGYIRRVYEISEPIENEIKRVFWWDENEDRHYPENIYKLIETSNTLHKIIKYRNVSKDTLEKELKIRFNFIKYLIENNINSQEDILIQTTNFYNKVIKNEK